jgi:hypothetical protein
LIVNPVIIFGRQCRSRIATNTTEDNYNQRRERRSLRSLPGRRTRENAAPETPDGLREIEPVDRQPRDHFWAAVPQPDRDEHHRR